MPYWLKKIIKLFLFTFVFIFVGKKFLQLLSTIEWNSLYINYFFLSAAITFELAARLSLAGLYTKTLKFLDKTSLPFPVILSVCWLSLLGRYVPGKLALIGSAVYMLSCFKIKARISMAVPVIVNMITVWVALFLSLPFLIYSINDIIGHNLCIWLPIVIFGCVLIAHPKILVISCNFFLKKFSFAPIGHVPKTCEFFPALGITFLQCTFSGLASWFTIRSLFPIGIEEIPIIISISSLAGVIGLLAVFSPAGLGVREGIYFLTLSPIIGKELAVITTILLRLIQTGSDILTGFIGWYLWTINKRNNEKNE